MRVPDNGQNPRMYQSIQDDLPVRWSNAIRHISADYHCSHEGKRISLGGLFPIVYLRLSEELRIILLNLHVQTIYELPNMHMLKPYQWSQSDASHCQTKLSLPWHHLDRRMKVLRLVCQLARTSYQSLRETIRKSLDIRTRQLGRTNPTRSWRSDKSSTEVCWSKLV